MTLLPPAGLLLSPLLLYELSLPCRRCHHPGGLLALASAEAVSSLLKDTALQPMTLRLLHFLAGCIASCKGEVHQLRGNIKRIVMGCR